MKGLAALLISALAFAASAQGTFEAGDGAFLLNGEPYVVKAAELHYPRIPKEYWEHRIEMSKALGMNTVCMYIFWNIHEPEEGKFDFTGQNDIAEFVRLAQKHGMNVIVRPGPYVCAEWEMGGLPWWLLKKKDIRLREEDPYFLERVGIFMDKVGEQLAPLTIGKGGPIIMVQVENEYGSYGIDKPYVAKIRDMVRQAGFDDVALFQCDWSSNFLNNGLDDLVWTLNFGTGADVQEQFKPLRGVRPDAPLMCSEYWSGWFDKWGANHETRPADEMVAGLEQMLDNDISFSLYMTHGGTSFGHWAGSNSPGFAPDVTSYDYDAPINERGTATPKYHLLRDMMARHTEGELPTIPAEMPLIEIPQFQLTEYLPLSAGVDSVITSPRPLTFEDMDMGWGSAVYSTILPALPAALLTINDPHDYAQVFVNNKFIGTINRVDNEKSIQMPAVEEGDTLNILVEGMGRINFGRAIKDFKGITDNVAISYDGNETILTDWTIYRMPDDVNPFLNEAGKTVTENKRGYYRGHFVLDKLGDTFLDVSKFGKGQVYVNGHPLGRYWNIGPQQSLYLPMPWLKEGENEVIVIDIVGPEEAVAKGVTEPLMFVRNHKREQKLDFDLDSIVFGETILYNPKHNIVKLPADKQGKYLAIKVLSTAQEGSPVDITEIYAIDSDGRKIARENWAALYASSANAANGNHTPDKTFDLQESTYWESEGSEMPQILIIDMGKTETVGGLQIMSRLEAGSPGAPGEIQVAIF